MEIRDLYDENKILTNKTILKGEKVPKGFYYLTVVVWIENSKGELLIQRTSPSKHHMLSTTGGHPKSGESSIKGIITEIKEEIGIDVEEKELTLFKTIKTEDDFVDLYYLKKDINLNDIIIQEEEVESVYWMSKEKIEKEIDNKEFLPPHVDFYKLLLDYLDNKNN